MSIERFTQGDTLILTSEEEGEVLRLRERICDKTAVIEPAGKLSSEVVHDVEDELVSMALVCDNVVIDMDKVDYISNAVIRVILDLQHLIDSRQGELRLRRLSSDVYRVFEDMGIEDIFMIESV